ncbi:MAG: HNH endonuclease [Selenomonadaceae bacterium]|nr:HNH endonuclease [Selenomonadaceae bacterium]
MTENERTRRNERYADYKLAYAALMLCYPFGLENLDGEEWRDVAGYEGRYQISNYGRVKSLTENQVKILKPHLHTGGYLRVSLGRQKKFKIHRLVAETFLDNPLNLAEVDHIHGNKMDNYFKNLEWVTLKENKRRAFKNGLYPSGEKKI